MEEILSKKSAKKIILLGNEAIVRGALEAGVQFVSTYPGTPASEIGDTFFKISKKVGIYFEYSTNEKVALEAGIGASFSGLKTLVAMKNFGLNVCSDALLPFVYTGSKESTVIVAADDPSCHSSAQSEQNSRFYSHLVHIPSLEPSDPQECKDFVKLGFEISEKFQVPVLIRITTRVAHQRTPVILGKINIPRTVLGRFEKEPKKFVTMPPRVLEQKKELFEKIRKIKELSEKSPINPIKNNGGPTSINRGPTSIDKIGIITSGVSYLYVQEALKELNLSLPVLKLGFFYPLPKEKINKFIKKLKKVLIVEELEPLLEREIQRFAKDTNPKLQIFGKNILPEVGEIRPEYVFEAVAQLTGKKIKIKKPRLPEFPKRLPNLCPGCPYWLVFSAVKKVAPKNTVFGGDIGCYMLAGLPPHNLQDYLFCMGSSIGIGHGIKKAAGQKLIAFIGDSTFFHAGIPALINCVVNKSNPLIIVMDNQTTAMTGQQPHPGQVIKIEDIVKGCGVKNLKVIDPINIKAFEKTIKKFLEKKEVSVIIARRPCIFVRR